MLQNAYLLAKIGADTAENEQHFAEILPTDVPQRRPSAVAVSGRVSRRAELERVLQRHANAVLALGAQQGVPL